MMSIQYMGRRCHSPEDVKYLKRLRRKALINSAIPIFRECTDSALAVTATAVLFTVTAVLMYIVT